MRFLLLAGALACTVIAAWLLASTGCWGLFTGFAVPAVLLTTVEAYTWPAERRDGRRRTRG